MANEQQLQAARDLIKQQHYDEARALLKIIDHPTARQWLQKLDEIAPEKMAPNTPYVVTKTTPTISKTQPQNSSLFTGLLVIGVLLALGTAVYGTFFRPGLTAQAISPDIVKSINDANTRIDALDKKVNTAQLALTQTGGPDIVKSINDVSARIDALEKAMNATQPTSQQWEYKLVNLVPAVSLFAGDFSSAHTIGDLEVTENGSANALNYLNGLGADGWELVGFNNIDRVGTDLLFKRPKR